VYEFQMCEAEFTRSDRPNSAQIGTFSPQTLIKRSQLPARRQSIVGGGRPSSEAAVIAKWKLGLKGSVWR
jgi:hypothetical protein